MGGVVAKLIFKKGREKLSSTYTSLHDIPATDIDGNNLARLGLIT